MPHPKAKFLFILAAIFTLIFYSAISFMTARGKSAHFDETAHIIAGYLTQNQNDYRLNTSNMIISQKLAALLLRHIAMPKETKELEQKLLTMPYLQGSEVFILGLSFLNAGAFERAQSILMRSRSVMICLGGILLFSVALCSARIFGLKGGLISIAFLASCPSMISLSGIVGTEIPCALFFFLTAWSFWTLLHKVNLLTLLAFSASLACLLATKISSLAFFPWAIIVLFLKFFNNRPLEISFLPAKFATTKTEHRMKKCEIRSKERILFILIATFILAGLLVFLGIWGLYDFRYSAAPPSSSFQINFDWDKLLAEDSISTRIIAFAKKWRIFPEAFLYNFAGFRALTHSCPAFFMGETSSSGWTSYFPLLFLAKTHLPLLVAFIASISILAYNAISLRHQGKNNTANLADIIYEILPFLLFIVVFMGIAMTARINIGHRHIFPIYPFIYVLTGALAIPLAKKNFLQPIFVSLMIFSSFVSAILTYPNSLSYVSPLFGGSYKAYTKFVDSNLDWGQELPALKKWLDMNQKHFAGINAYFSYFGSGFPEKYGIQLERLHGYLDPRMNTGARTSIVKKLKPGAYFISATMLQPVYYSRENIIFPTQNFSGIWTSKNEEKYKEMKKVAEPLLDAIESAKNDIEKQKELLAWFKDNRAPEIPENKSEEFWFEFLAAYDLARFAKLANYLRNREPDTHINYSIYLFILNKEELSEALK